MLHLATDGLLNQKCKIPGHEEFEYMQICLDSNCIEKSKSILCEKCLFEHCHSHFSKIRPYGTVMSANILGNINQCMNEQEDKILKLSIEKPEIIKNIEQTFDEALEYTKSKLDYFKVASYLKAVETLFYPYSEKIYWKKWSEYMTNAHEKLMSTGTENPEIIKNWISKYAFINSK